jgi:hypothetical protein
MATRPMRLCWRGGDRIMLCAESRGTGQDAWAKRGWVDGAFRCLGETSGLYRMAESDREAIESFFFFFPPPSLGGSRGRHDRELVDNLMLTMPPTQTRHSLSATTTTHRGTCTTWKGTRTTTRAASPWPSENIPFPTRRAVVKGVRHVHARARSPGGGCRRSIGRVARRASSRPQH